VFDVNNYHYVSILTLFGGGGVVIMKLDMIHDPSSEKEAPEPAAATFHDRHIGYSKMSGNMCNKIMTIVITGRVRPYPSLCVPFHLLNSPSIFNISITFNPCRKSGTSWKTKEFEKKDP
jgi:hypothetical protein